jgi:hypothetical protein
MGSGQAQLNTTKTGSIDIFSPISICLSAQLGEFRPWADGGMANLTDTELGRDSDQVAAYVAELTGELALVSRRHGLDALAYLLDMARLEAESAAQRPKKAEAKPKIAHG